MENTNIFTIDCPYYGKGFSKVSDLLEDVIKTGQDPNYSVLKNGRRIGILSDYIG